MRNTPSRISPETFPIAASATAPAYYFEAAPEVVAQPAPEVAARTDAQQALFSLAATDPRVIPFDSLTTPAQKESIRARAAELARPAPLKTEKVEVRHARPRKSVRAADQRRLEFQGQEEVLSPPQSNILCDAPVAPVGLRAEAALIDGAIVMLGCVVCVAMYLCEGGTLALDKRTLPFLLAALAMVPVAYKLLWTFAGRDSVGIRHAGLTIVDFDGNPPAHSRRYYRLAGSFLSVLAAGIGVLWALVDEDGLTWHDHISGTFPTFALDETEDE